MKDPVAEFFSPNGALASTLKSYEERPEQVEVARRVAQALGGQERLVAEAGTGVGKTLAYLLPAVLSDLRVVVSTGTKTLQEQLVRDDLPLLASALGRPIDVQVMKGRTNYLCHLRTERFTAQSRLAIDDEARLLAAVLAWRSQTHSGDRAELSEVPDDWSLWHELTATSEQCLGRTCQDFERCFVTQMRRRAQTAKLVIVNHHLYFADLALRSRTADASVSLLPPHDVVIFDEAHDLDEVAAQHFGYQVSLGRLTDLQFDVARGLEEGRARLTPLLEGLMVQARRLFELLPAGEGRTLLSAPPPAVGAAHTEVDALLERLEAELAGLSEEQAPILARRTATLAAELAFVLASPARRSAVIETAAPGANDAYVRYVEQNGRHRALVARPVDVAPLIGAHLDTLPAVFVSATLAVDGSFEHFERRLGITQAREVAVGSPFDYRSTTRLYLPDDLPDPDQPGFVNEAAERARLLVEASGGGAFVLCTSHRVLPTMAAALTRRDGPRVLVQGDAPRGHLLEEFRAHGDAVLVATMSFWQGVDVPGSALRLVIIDKLPFASPSDPVTAARLEYLRHSGQDPFSSYQLPQAALLLRQGFGRLIRRKTDQGLVAVLDRRLLTRRYGAVFLRSLPPCPQVRSLGEAQQFLHALTRQATQGADHPHRA